MAMYYQFIIGFLGLVMGMSGCTSPSVKSTSFYYWKTVYQNDSIEQAALRAMHSPRLYVRIMDVDQADDNSMPVPISPVRFDDPLPDSIDLVPVVFVVHSIFKKMDDQQIAGLADKVLDFVAAKVRQAGKMDYSELQVDCDWTGGSRDAYFNFLEKLQESPKFKNKSLSITLRLHQVRDIKRSGVPPVDRALVMCYNMGNLRRYGSHNSIFDLREMEAYLKNHLRKYPLKLDIALPLFSWKVVFRNKEYAGISKRLKTQSLLDSSLFVQQDATSLYTLKKDLPDIGLRSGDVIRNEQVEMSDLYQASDFLSRYLPGGDFNLIFYHLDKDILEKFPHDELQKISEHF